MFGRKKIAILVAEFLGTFILTSAIYSAVSVHNLIPFFAAITAALTLGLLVLVVGPTSGAHVNPAVTIGMWTLRKIETTQAVVYIAAQMLGGLVAWRFNEYLMQISLKNLATGKFDLLVLIAEAVGTLVFTFGIAAALYQGYKGLRQAVTIGTSLGVGILIASYGSHGLLNPAVAIGVHSWNFAYAVGPLIGGILGMNLYALLFADTGNSTSVAKLKIGNTTLKITKNTTKRRK